MADQKRVEQWEKIKESIDKLNDRSRFQKPNVNLEKLIKKYEELDEAGKVEQGDGMGNVAKPASNSEKSI